MKCPYCANPESKVVDSRPADEGASKLLGSMLKSCEKRSVSLGTLENIVSEIEQKLQNEMEREVTTVRIGNMVMEKLKQVDEVAYVRFASVYRQFKDINTFMTEGGPGAPSRFA